ncbi:hypothetical protein SELMODRAFT_74749 [Selaginella moellendorffii]|uniref:Pentacotripeptide-repeat region of PRORP domain-containing protein n=1 Tax=Selaginella moellendorffii TaxID=88036 RepID=D8QPJ5_SELML|nr:hypothetical protein SELMODRAFT_74749 [Selaginella moellendorffii]
MRRSASRALIFQEQDDIARIVRSVGQDLEQARWIHAQIEQSQHRRNRFLANLLVEMYGKCGRIREARARVFDRMPQHTIVSWNAIMAAFALSSSAMTAIVSFQRLILDGLPVNSITFLVLLTACSHLGLVDQSRDYLVAMAMDFGVPPSVDHYSCMVDVLGRSGQLQFATSLLATMPMVPDYVAWCSVLSASKNLHDVESGVFAARSGLELRARDPGLNLLLSNIYFGGLQRISPDLS